MKLRRLLGMGFDEMAVRGRQAGLRLADRALARRPAPRPRAAAGDAATGLLERFRAGMRERFFPGAVEDDTARVAADLFPEHRDRVLTAAAEAAAGRFDLLGYRGLSFGSPPDWRLDPVSGRRAPATHWTRIDPLDPRQAGDSKVIWELNRHQWMVRLGQAYRLTGDETHARVFAARIREWLAANPAGSGINWTSSLEVALRLIAWCWALCLFRDSPALAPDLYLGLLTAAGAHARHVERYLSLYFSPNTHLTGEALGLFYAGVVFPEHRAAPRWRALGAGILEEQIGRQVLPDGVHFERSACYQRYTAEIYLHYLILARRIGAAPPPAVAARLQDLLDALLALQRPDGTAPPLGDADGGWLLPLDGRGPDDPRGVFAVAAALFGRSDYAWAAGGAAPETAWLLGWAGLAAARQLRPAPPAGEPSRLLPDGGYAVLRSGWAGDAHHLVLDGGPLGCPVSGGHGHADLLAVQCAAFGEPFLVDPGTFCYTADPVWRDHFRGTTAHSTLTVDGRGQAAPAGPFAWRTRPGARLRRFAAAPDLVVADAEHDAYARRGDPVRHRRRVLLARGRFFVIADDVDGAGEREVALRFQFAPLPVALEADSWVRARGRGGRGLLLRVFCRAPLEIAILEGETDPIAGWVSPDYGRRLPAPLLVCGARARLPLRFLTLLIPVEDADAPPPAAAVIAGDPDGGDDPGPGGGADGAGRPDGGGGAEIAGLEIRGAGGPPVRVRIGADAERVEGTEG